MWIIFDGVLCLFYCTANKKTLFEKCFTNKVIIIILFKSSLGIGSGLNSSVALLSWVPETGFLIKGSSQLCKDRTYNFTRNKNISFTGELSYFCVKCTGDGRNKMKVHVVQHNQIQKDACFKTSVLFKSRERWWFRWLIGNRDPANTAHQTGPICKISQVWLDQVKISTTLHKLFYYF